MSNWKSSNKGHRHIPQNQTNVSEERRQLRVALGLEWEMQGVQDTIIANSKKRKSKQE